MGKRDDRLHSSEIFKQALMTRPISRNGSVMVYRISMSAGVGLGFILPRKLIRSAVMRNQIKRWARAILREHESSQIQPSAFVIRVTQPLSKTMWQTPSRQTWKNQFKAVFMTALAHRLVLKEHVQC
jgi:ribonuclease P protein component